MQQSAEFHLLGRVMDPEFGAAVEAAGAVVPNLSIDGACDHGEAVEAIRGSDVLVCSSRDETMPVTILEALSLGKAIVSTNVGGIGEILTDGRDALLVRSEDPQALAAAMKRLWESPQLAQELGRNARATFEKNFTEDRFGSDFRELLFEVMARYATDDPYAKDKLRNRLDSHSPRPRMTPPRRVLFVSHDLSLSGAPMMLFHAVRWCRDNGLSVAVTAPKDGPLGQKLREEDIPLIIDPVIETGHGAFARFARDFDCIVANTIRSGAVVRAMSGNIPIAWWLHEPGSVGGHFLRSDAKLREALQLAGVLFAPSEQTAAVYRTFTDRPVKCVRNAIPDLGLKPNRSSGPSGPLRFLLLASIEPRKGQDVFVEALALLPRELQEAAHFQIAGRNLAADFSQKVNAVASTLKNVTVSGALNHTEAIELMSGADVIVSASRDEAMPTVTILEAMCLGKALIATTVGGAREILVEGENSLLVRPETPAALAAAIRRFIDDPALVSELGAKARETYEKHFTMERFGKEFGALIDEVIAARTPGSREMSN
jgi:glycosyltransferase involved in cell wall biosynthesis